VQRTASRTGLLRGCVRRGVREVEERLDLRVDLSGVVRATLATEVPLRVPVRDDGPVQLRDDRERVLRRLHGHAGALARGSAYAVVHVAATDPPSV
jgi:hypothetical protein